MCKQYSGKSFTSYHSFPFVYLLTYVYCLFITWLEIVTHNISVGLILPLFRRLASCLYGVGYRPQILWHGDSPPLSSFLIYWYADLLRVREKNGLLLVVSRLLFIYIFFCNAGKLFKFSIHTLSKHLENWKSVLLKRRTGTLLNLVLFLSTEGTFHF